MVKTMEHFKLYENCCDDYKIATNHLQKKEYNDAIEYYNRVLLYNKCYRSYNNIAICYSLQLRKRVTSLGFLKCAIDECISKLSKSNKEKKLNLSIICNNYAKILDDLIASLGNRRLKSCFVDKMLCDANKFIINNVDGNLIKAIIYIYMELYNYAITTLLNNYKNRNEYYNNVIASCYLKLDEIYKAEEYFILSMKENNKIHSSYQLFKIYKIKNNVKLGYKYLLYYLHNIKEKLSECKINLMSEFLLQNKNNDYYFEIIMMKTEITTKIYKNLNYYAKVVDALINNDYSRVSKMKCLTFFKIIVYCQNHFKRKKYEYNIKTFAFNKSIINKPIINKSIININDSWINKNYDAKKSKIRRCKIRMW